MSSGFQCLSDLKPGQSGVVREFVGARDLHFRLMELGILPGTRIHCLRTAPLGDPLEVELRGYHLSLRKAEAATIAMGLVEDEA